MGFVVADGFDDRYFIDNDWNHGDIMDGWGLYDDVYIGGAQYYFPDWSGNREVGRYGGWAAMLSNMDMASSYIFIEPTITPGKDWSGGIAVNSSTSDCSMLFCRSATRYGPIIEVDMAGDIEVRRSKVGSTSTEIVARSAASARFTNWGWHYVTFQFHAGDIGSDWIKVWLDGELIIDVSSTTLNFGGQIERIELPDNSTAVDDVWLRDDTNVILPEARILALFPDGAGDDTECTPVGEANNYQNVSDFEQNFDYGYNLVDAGEKDSFEMDDITDQVSAGVVHALVARFLVKGDTGNTEDLRPYVISGGNKYNGSAVTPVEGRYTYIQEIWEMNPDTSAAWTVGELDAVQIGYEAV